MVVHYNALLDLQLPGIQSVRPVDGWPSIRSYKLRLRCHECSELLQFKEISLGSYNAAKKKRFLRRPIPCPNCCSRDGEVFANEFRGTISGDKIILMRFQADGLQPEDGFIKLDGPLIATDLQGNNSEEFYLELNGEPDGIHINVDFQDAAGHRRRIEGRVKVIFQRLRL